MTIPLFDDKTLYDDSFSGIIILTQAMAFIQYSIAFGFVLDDETNLRIKVEI